MTKIHLSVLSDNSVRKQPFRAEHGFSILIETRENTLLLDTGGSDLFYDNSRKMNIELFGVDHIILSHGHYDHSSGIPLAITEASHAILHLHPAAMNRKFIRDGSSQRYIGLPDKTRQRIESASENGRVDFTDKPTTQIAPGISLFTTAIPAIPENWPFIVADGIHGIPDTFEDELSVLIDGNEGVCVLTGCAHCGIDSICKNAENISGKPVRHLIGGSHLDAVPDSRIREVAGFFSERDTQLHLGHCTGINGYCRLYSIMAEKLDPLHAGQRFSLKI